RDEPHRDGHRARHEAGRGLNRRKRGALPGERWDAGKGQNGGVHEDDVGHHHERGEAAPHLGADRRSALAEREVAVEHAQASSRPPEKGSPPPSPGTTRRATVMKPVCATIRWKGRTDVPSMFQGLSSVSKVSTSP